MNPPNWKWLTDPLQPYTWGFFVRVVIKGLVLFALANMLFALLNPLPLIGQISIYNWLVPGRERLPYADQPAAAYSLSINNIDAMFATHAIADEKADDEFRVLLIGDSATWGFLLEPENTLAGQINAGHYRTAAGERVVAYNIGYPTMSLTKDLLLLDYAMQYDPDLVIWLVTLESFPREEQLESPPVQYNPEHVRDLIEQYDLNLDPDDPRFQEPESFFDRTIIGQRRALADWLRLQTYGVMWAITGIDQVYPADIPLRQSDFEADYTWHQLQEEQPIPADYLAFDVLKAGAARTGEVPFLLVNEPMFITAGRNKAIRYNFFYPRWVYDAYRVEMRALAEAQGWRYLDLWNVIEPTEFTDSPVHLTPAGSHQLSEILGSEIVDIANKQES